MARFSGKVGYLITAEEIVDGEPTGIWKETYKERPYYGDIEQISSRWSSGSNLNDDVVLSNSISIVADPFAYENFQLMKYVVWKGQKWKIESASVQYPRIVLSVGGVYNADPDGLAQSTP